MPTDDHRSPAQARIEQPLDRHEERVEIEAADPRRDHASDRALYKRSAQAEPASTGLPAFCQPAIPDGMMNTFV
jgi:hypothetical protein